MPNAIHSAGEKCPGNAGKTFIRKSNKETAIPSPVTIRLECNCTEHAALAIGRSMR